MSTVWPNGSTTIPRVSSEFGPRKAPGPGGSTNHQGIDLIGFRENKSPFAGTVVRASWYGGYGLCVDVRRADGTIARIAHNSSVSVSVGQQVAAGQTVGVQGMTGTATGVHTHFEIRPGGGAAVNPRGWMAVQIGGGGGGGAGVSKVTQDRQNWVLSIGIGVGPHGADGREGPDTKAAYAEYQRRLKARGWYSGKIDGIWGAGTQAGHEKMYAEVTAPKPAPAPARRLLHVGVSGQDVADWQRWLATRYPAYETQHGKLVVDGEFGSRSKAWTAEYQRRVGLHPDGIVGPATRAKSGT